MISLDARRNDRLDSDERAVMNRILLREIPKRTWYHKIKICEEIITPGFEWDALWNNIRDVRTAVDYRGKSVLDLGSWDGLWAFEAEALGASAVIATDCNTSWRNPYYFGLENFLLVREAVFSNVMPLWNVAATQLTDRLNVVMNNNAALAEGFDIVHHLGLLYHLRDPFYSLSQARAVLKDGGTLLLETAVHTGSGEVMHLNTNNSKFYKDHSTWWMPTVDCCIEMLRMSYFEVISHKMMPTQEAVSRLCLIAKGVPADNSTEQRKAANQYTLDSSFDHGFGEFMQKRIPYDDLTSTDVK